MIKHIHITNFKSLGDVSVSLEPVTVLIGRSGTGKSNLVEALRFLRGLLVSRDESIIQGIYGGWPRVVSATAVSPMTVSFNLVFDAPGISGDFEYTLKFQQRQAQSPPQFCEEMLSVGGRVLFHQQQGKWLQPPPLNPAPPSGSILLGALTGVQEATVAHLVLTTGIGCYAFPDSVLTPWNQPSPQNTPGLADAGANYLQTFIGINDNLQTWQSLRDIAATLQHFKPSLKSLSLLQPQRQKLVAVYEGEGRIVTFDLDQESEGFRRMLACLLALHQSPPKQTIIFDEPEKGIYPAGLALLADEFKGFASKGRGQVLLTTHSPDFLNHFEAEQIRVVEMHGYTTRIGPVAKEQLEALREHYLEPKELLTVDEARLEGSLAEAQ